jgi:arginase
MHGLRQDRVMWTRDLDLVVPLWQGADDARVRDGAGALAALTTPGPRRELVQVPAGPSAEHAGVRHHAAVQAALRAQGELLEQLDPDRLLTLGGDCTVEVAAVAHLARRYGRRLFVLWIDAHGDLNTPISSPSGTAHGMPLRMLLEADPDGPLAPPGCLQPRQVTLVGSRDLDPAEVEYVEEHRVPRLHVLDLITSPARLAALPPAGAAVYVHLDLDVLDPSALPAVAVPTAGGLAVSTLTAALQALVSAHDVVGIGITEYVPQVEHDPQILTRVLEALGLTGTDH